jgi:hypothetical protein
VHVKNANNDNYSKLVEATGGYEGLLKQPEEAFDELFKKVGTNVIEETPLACEWKIPASPEESKFNKNLVNVKYTPSEGEPIEFKKAASKKSCADNLGWFYDDEDNPKKIMVCPTACEEIQKDNAERINIIIGCQTVIIV